MEFEEINHLLELARIEIKEEEKEKLSKDLESILNYVQKLNEIDTSAIEPMAGGTFLENVYREDEINPHKENLEKELKNAALKLTNDFWEIPPIF